MTERKTIHSLRVRGAAEFNVMPTHKGMPITSLLGDASSPNWIALTLLNSWHNYGGSYNPVGFFASQGLVFVRGLIAGGASGSVAFNLPAAVRPAYICMFPVVANQAFGYCSVSPNGDVGIIAASTVWVCLDGLVFPAA